MGVSGSKLDVVVASIGRFATDDLGFFEPGRLEQSSPAGVPSKAWLRRGCRRRRSFPPSVPAPFRFQ
jgi:hypothetical protein